MCNFGQMYAGLIIDSISRHIRLSDEEQQHFLSLVKPKSFKRKQFVLREGQVCKYSTFVTEGCLRGFTTDKNGFEHVINFAPVGWWIADMYSLLSQKPGILNIEALENTEVLLLAKKDQEQLYRDIPKFERFFRVITENSLVSFQQRLIDNLSLPAEERYQQFCQRYPMLIQTLPKKQIASYIGVTPEFFSRMQRRLLLKK
jgi:CRP-like cAMP-binding protein